MAVDFTKPAITDIYNTQFVPNIVNNVLGVAKMLDGESVSGLSSGVKRYNSANQIFEQWNGSSWVEMPLVYIKSSQYTASDVLAKLLTVDGNGSSLDADLLDGQHGSYYTNASNLASGTVPDARFPATLPAVSGANLTNLNASNLASGTVPDARFPATLPAVSGANLTNLNASNLASGMVPSARISGSYTGITAVGTLTGLTSTGAINVAPVSVGRISLVGGSGASPGYVEFRTPDGTRRGYIGWSDGSLTRNQITGENGWGWEVVNGISTRPASIAFSTAPTFSAMDSNVFYFGTLTANVTSMTISNASDGQTIQIRFVQDATGGRTVALPSGAQVSGSINTAANSVTWLVMTYVASASRWEGTWTRVS